MKKALLVVLLTACSVMLFGQSSSTKAKVGNLKGQLKDIRSDKAVVRGKLNTIRGTMRDAKDELADVDAKMESVESRIHRTKSRLGELQSERKLLSAQLEKASKEFLAKSARAKERLRYIRMHGETTLVSTFLHTSSMNELASRQYILETVARNDRQLFMDVKILRDSISLKRQRNAEIMSENTTLLGRQRTEHAEWNEAVKAKQEVLNRLTDKAADVQHTLAKLNAEEDAIEAKIDQYLNMNITPGGRPGRLMMPVNGRMSSPFGMRYHPILHKSRMHTGQDIAAPYGTTIRAAAGGTVVMAGRMGGYGNVVIISHGGGMTTLYGHCSSLLVSGGQHVQRGQSIARVGSTGLSTGPHCHFEVAIGGQKVNPRKYL